MVRVTFAPAFGKRF